MNKNKQLYTSFFKEITNGVIFQSPLWLDTVAGTENWDVALSIQGDFVNGAFPYVTNTKLGLKQVTLPYLTPHLGPIFNFPSDLSESNKLSYKKKVLNSLIEQLPKTDRFITQTDFDFDYWLPFYWKGFQQTTRYSFVLNTQKSESELLANCKPNIRKHIKNSSVQFQIEESTQTDTLFEMHKADLNSKNADLHFDKDQLSKLYKVLYDVDAAKVLHAVDSNNDVACAFLLVFDKKFTHYLVGSVDPAYRNSGVMSLMMWEAIKESRSRGLQFNFEGSMIQSIERFFSSFDGQPVPYMKISKTSNKWLKEFTRFNH